MKTQEKPRAEPAADREAEAEPKKRRSPAVYGIAAIVLVIAVIEGIRYYGYASTHTGTDDAYVTSEITQIAPQVSGTVTKIFVKENDHVKAGQLLAQIDPSTFQQAVDQAKANLDLAVAQEQAAETSQGLTQAQGNAQVESARGVVEESNAGIGSARADVAKAAAGVASAKAAVSAADANVANAKSALSGAKAQVIRSQAAVSGAQWALQTAKSGVPAAQAGVTSAQAADFKANQDFKRAQVLSHQGAISAQQLDAFRAAAQESDAQLQTAQQAVSSAQDGVSQAQANLESMRAQLQASQAAVQQANSQVIATQASVQSAQSGVSEAFQVQLQAEQSVTGAQGKTGQAAGQLSQAQTVSQQVQVSQKQVNEAKARVEQSQAALAQAQINLQDCNITAPEDGQVTHKAITVGSLVQPGGSMMTLVPDELMWVVGNYKETQLAGVKPGLPTEVEVDAIPGHTFKGTVQSISSGTGSTFTLLPPDNATGNFTKVVQRVSVKIVFDPNQKDLNLLRAGMSCTATITLK